MFSATLVPNCIVSSENCNLLKRKRLLDGADRVNKRKRGFHTAKPTEKQLQRLCRILCVFMFSLQN